MSEAFTTVTRKIFRVAANNAWLDEVHRHGKRYRTDKVIEVALLVGAEVDRETFDAHEALGGTIAIFRDGALLTLEDGPRFAQLWQIMLRDSDTLVMVQEINILWENGCGEPNPLDD